MVRLTAAIAILGVMSVAQSCGLTLAEQPLSCQDFLQTWGTKPPELSFTDCKKIKMKGLEQTDQLVASYAVSGKHAAKIERVLVGKYKMPPLRFQCCGWVSTTAREDKNPRNSGSYKDKKGQQYSISMSSEETVVQDWSRIPRFNVRVSTYLGEI
jgi:hypothetical protein